MTPDSRVTLHAVIALLRTMSGVTEADVQAVSAYLAVAIEQAERAA